MGDCHATKAHVLSLAQAVAGALRGKPVTVTALFPAVTRAHFFNDAQMHDVVPVNAVADRAQRRRGRMAGKRIRMTGALNMIFSAMPRLVPRAITTRLAALFLKKQAQAGR
jgi:short-subunit dehydrogenase